MYDIQSQIKVGNSLIRTVAGSIFEAENHGAEGVAIFVPCGLTALRSELPRYMIPFGLPIGNEKAFTIFRSERQFGSFTVLCDENRSMSLYPARGIPMLLDMALSIFQRHGIRKIAMNGIRVYWPQGVKDRGHLAEAYLVDNAVHWLETHSHNFESIDFVDLRGGFGKIHLEDSTEPSVRDAKAMPIVSEYFSVQNAPIQNFEEYLGEYVASQNQQTRPSVKPIEYGVTMIDGHMLVNLQEGHFLVDTGSPTSFARDGHVSFGGEMTDVAESAMGMLDADMLSRFVGTHVDGLVGMDILSRNRLTFGRSKIFVGGNAIDNVNDIPVYSGPPLRDSSFIGLETESFMGIPVVKINVNKRLVSMFVDSGAKVSYLNPKLLADFPVEETLHDFYPGIGEFDVGVSTVCCDLKNWPVQARFGRLPPLLQMTLMMGGVDGILGHDFFSSYTIRIESGGASVLFVPHI